MDVFHSYSAIAGQVARLFCNHPKLGLNCKFSCHRTYWIPFQCVCLAESFLPKQNTLIFCILVWLMILELVTYGAVFPCVFGNVGFANGLCLSHFITRQAISKCEALWCAVCWVHESTLIICCFSIEMLAEVFSCLIFSCSWGTLSTLCFQRQVIRKCFPEEFARYVLCSLNTSLWHQYVQMHSTWAAMVADFANESEILLEVSTNISDVTIHF